MPPSIWKYYLLLELSQSSDLCFVSVINCKQEFTEILVDFIKVKSVLTAPHRPRVSVVIPTYNAAAYLSETLASVFSQSVRDLEVLVVDDGSEDQTEDLVAAADERLKYIYLEHSGVPAKVRNYALGAVQGDFIAFLDSDDLWIPTKLERQIEFMEQENVELCFTDFTTFGATQDKVSAFDQARSSMSRLQKERACADSWVITSSSLLEDCLLRGPIPIWTSTILVRRNSLNKVGRFNEEMHLDDDTQMWFRFAKQCRVGYIDDVLAMRRVRPTSLTAVSRFVDAGMCSLRTFDTMDQWITLSDGERAAARFCSSQITFDLGYYAFSQGNPEDARRWFRRSLKEKFSYKTMSYLLASMLAPSVLAYLRGLKRSVNT